MSRTTKRYRQPYCETGSKRLKDTKTPECKPGQPLPIDLNALIDEVIVSPYAEKWVTETVKSVVRQYGFKFPVNRSKLLDSPD